MEPVAELEWVIILKGCHFKRDSFKLEFPFIATRSVFDLEEFFIVGHNSNLPFTLNLRVQIVDFHENA